MRVGMHLGYQNLHGAPDVETFMKETKLAVEAEAMGFDYVGPVEHHFTDYAACPAPFEVLSYIAAQTSTIDLITAAVILPWNSPLRVVEQAIQLDILSGGRLILGMGRGAARREFRSFGVELADSREMFDEAALIVMEGLEPRWRARPAMRFRQRALRSQPNRPRLQRRLASIPQPRVRRLPQSSRMSVAIRLRSPRPSRFRQAHLMLSPKQLPSLSQRNPLRLLREEFVPSNQLKAPRCPRQGQRSQRGSPPFSRAWRRPCARAWKRSRV